MGIRFKALSELEPILLALNGLYKIGLKTGWYRRLSKPPSPSPRISNLQSLFFLPPRQQILESIGADGLQATLAEADEIVVGRVRLFGARPVDLDFSLPGGLRHWSEYENRPGLLSTFHLPHDDVKFLWEPARFGFAFTLGRAYQFSGDERYPATFWHYFGAFSAANPAYLGPNWMSGQEVALRLIAFVWAGQIFSASAETTPKRLGRLASSIAAHAARIPSTLIYARSQNNNHLLIEAAGLYTASVALPEYAQAKSWRKLGIKWLNWCMEKQIDETGEYIQHSANYHRLMLQTALWANAVASNPRADEALSASDEGIASRPASQGARNNIRTSVFSERAERNLARATGWLLALTDQETGHVPNLGANDGASIFPLASLPFADFRPTLQAASKAFCDAPAFGAGPWDETAFWLREARGPGSQSPATTLEPLAGKLVNEDSSAHLRAAHFSSRPSHADQLHLDLWWLGLNVALDPGTYLYNAPPPWDNALTSALVHNTVTVNGLDQMTRAGKFLYLDWAQAKIVERATDHIIAEHDGYRRLGVLHRRSVTAIESGWRILDELVVTAARARKYRLHWSLMDGDWRLDASAGGVHLQLATPHGWMGLSAGVTQAIQPIRHSLVRAGQLLDGSADASPTRGWVSPTYGVKLPALSVAIEVESAGEISFVSEFTFPAHH